MNQFVPSYNISHSNNLYYTHHPNNPLYLKEQQQNMEHHHIQIIDKDTHTLNSHIHYSNPITVSHPYHPHPHSHSPTPNIHYSSENYYSLSPPNLLNNNYNHYSSSQSNSPSLSSTPCTPPCIISNSKSNTKFNFKIDTSKCSSTPSLSQSSTSSSIVPNVNNLSYHGTPTIDSNDIPSSLCIPLLKLKSLSMAPPPTPLNLPMSSNNSPRSQYYVPEEMSPFITPNQSPRNTNNIISQGVNNSLNSTPSSQLSSPNTPQSLSLSNTPLSSPRGGNQPIDKVEEHWRKLEYYTSNLNNYVYESIKSKDFSNLSELNEKVEEIKNSIKEIEIINSIAKTLPPQTRARKKRSTKAEKLQRDAISVKRTYVTTPKSKGNHCAFCGTLETPEWRKGPGGMKSLCNACGLHYAKNLKRENKLKSQSTATTDGNDQSMKIENLLK
ncbi:putative GATA-binding transcription factor [Tieghemostelium lacteum]|uniref:Putative GATA-binding transcription factor n=1 Tax=Tieghemostelium lacteum TaxID=361077 RepID=A0A152A956_TIELA|nr:putative GATA-binding transcription factor [Tieghemostelium lacteum]|eukprot:KYR02661.1 putative GATA-binding transcription factor [Tieghemostelium lacteum]